MGGMAGTSSNLKIVDWDEYVNPDYVKIKLSSGKVLEIKRSYAKGGKAAYQTILTLLDSMDRSDKAKSLMLKIVGEMSRNLS